MFRKRIIYERERWDRYTKQQRDRVRAERQAAIEERRRRAWEREQSAQLAQEAARDFARLRDRELALSQFRDAESSDPYDGLHELAEEAAGLAQRPIADPSAGGSRHTFGWNTSVWLANEYSGYDGSEEQDMRSNTYEPTDEE
jgi:hypothetical protein